MIMMADRLSFLMDVPVSPVRLGIEKSHISVPDNHGEEGRGSFGKPEIHVEILQQNSSALSSENVILLAHNTLKNLSYLKEDMLLSEFEEPDVQKHIKSISLNVSNLDCDKEISLEGTPVNYHTFRLNTDAKDAEDIEAEGTTAATYWLLPADEFHGLWESLVFDADIKSQLLKFVSKSLVFADKGVNSKIISWNKVVLLHGPSGTGKTSLCQALAQKLCIRLQHKYKYGQLIEINSHSLFSKWFSESGKLVLKMFDKIQVIIDDPEALVFVLIDEVESLAHSRAASLGGIEPSDSVRVVNALLTQLDNIRRYSNVVILTTSNITEAIDFALIDRADIKKYIGPPSVPAIYNIYSSCIKELQRVGLIYTMEAILPLQMLSTAHKHGSQMMLQCSLKLKEISEKSLGFSGRTLRKIPYLAFASYVETSTTLSDFLNALSRTADDQAKDTEHLKKPKKE